MEYRVWCSSLEGAPDTEDGDYYSVFDNYEEALKYSEENIGSEEPVALILQEEYISETKAGEYGHVKEHPYLCVP